MKEQLKNLVLFHEKFDIPVGKRIGDTTIGQQHLHHKLMAEELEEFRVATVAGDLVEVADGLADVLFVLLSSVVAHGLQHCFEEIFQEVCDSNMSKLGNDGKPIYRDDGKIMKGETFFRPNIKAILDKHISREQLKDTLEDKS